MFENTAFRFTRKSLRIFFSMSLKEHFLGFFFKLLFNKHILTFLFLFYLTLLLENITILCYILLYRKVNQLHVYIDPPSLDFFPV